MLVQDRIRELIPSLLAWYHREKRSLPWRDNPIPYWVWISEIMLQQTRVEAVKPYFTRFIQEIPDISHLSSIEEEKLLKLWEGLGYYNRARNLQRTAQVLIEKGLTDLPADYDMLLSLPGVGPYTAGAVASIAFGLPYPAVDGNVLRVMSRIALDGQDIALAKTKEYWTQVLQTVLPRECPGAFNQAVMELGATVCLPNGLPKCTECPIRQYCLACGENRPLDFPVKSPKPQRRIEKKTVCFCVHEGKIALRKREKGGLLPGLWELPNGETENLPELFLDWGIQSGKIRALGSAKHIFTHVEWHMEGYLIEVEKRNDAFIWATAEELEELYALPTAFRKILMKGLESMH